MILLLLVLVSSARSGQSIETISSDLLTLETGHPKSAYEPEYGQPNGYYYTPPAHHNSYEPPLDYDSLTYPPHDSYPASTPKSAAYISSYHNNLPKSLTYPSHEPLYSPKSYSSATNSYPASSYGYAAPPPKIYDSYKPKKYIDSYTPPTYQSEYSKYKPKSSKYLHPSYPPQSSSTYPIDEYYKKTNYIPSYPQSKQSYPSYPSYSTYKPDAYNSYNPATYPTEYNAFKPYPPSAYPQSSASPNDDYHNKHPYSSPTSTSYHSYSPKADYSSNYDEEPNYSSNPYPPKYY